MKILLLSLYFTPDPAANSVIMTELAEELTQLGHQVTVIAAFPHYDTNQIWPTYRGQLVQKDEHQGIRVYRTYLYVPANKTNLLGRVLNYLSFNALSTLIGALAGQVDVILAPSPPLTIGLSAYLLSRLRRAPYIYNVQDIYPDVAIRLGVLTNPKVIRFFQALERFVYRHATAVSVLSEGFRQNLLGKGVPAEKVAIIPNFIDTTFMQPGPKDNAFARQHGLQDKVVVMYAGNVGLSQGLETLLQAAHHLQTLPDLRFLIVGNGAAKADLQAQAARLGLSNVIFLPFQPREQLPAMYATADISLVVLKQGIGAESVPSKAYTILASGRPLIAAIDAGSETQRLIEAAGCGLWTPPEQIGALAEAICSLYHQPGLRDQLGRNGRAYVESYYTRQAVGRQYAALLESLVKPRTKARPWQIEGLGRWM
ncbi:MAG TPA: glycosyltransferase family 4 protein [Anaerolineae bacterium]|nr:glycosyltransferase family 4 protein [Anaerolineae bacterium]